MKLLHRHKLGDIFKGLFLKTTNKVETCVKEPSGHLYSSLLNHEPQGQVRGLNRISSFFFILEDIQTCRENTISLKNNDFVF